MNKINKTCNNCLNVCPQPHHNQSRPSAKTVIISITILPKEKKKANNEKEMSPLTYPSSPASLGLSFHPISLNISSRRNCTKVVEKYLSAKTSLEMGDNSQSFIFPRLLSLSLPLPQLLHPLIPYCPRFWTPATTPRSPSATYSLSVVVLLSSNPPTRAPGEQW